MSIPISRARRVFAGVLAVLALVNAVVMPDTAHLFAMCSGLCSAWVLAFVPMPPLGTPLERVRAWIRDGHWQLPISARLMVLMAIIMHLIACAALLSGYR
jgi:hypothetical protein